MTYTKSELKAELRRRILLELRRRDPKAHRDAIRGLILKGLHAKQLEVVEALERGERYISLSCSRRAGKTYLLCSLIILKLLDAGFQQAVVFTAPTLGDGKDLIWGELSRMVREFHLDDWELSEHSGRIKTPAGAIFKIQGLNKLKHAEKPRGFDIIMFLTDESQEHEYLLKPLMAAVGPALSGRKGAFIAAGTPGIALQGYWYDICHGKEGFKNYGWTIVENTKNPRPGSEVLEEVLRDKGWTEDHPEFQREYLGRWVRDANYLVCEYDEDANTIYELPEDYGVHWKHVIGIDYGFVDACCWVVCAVNPFKAQRIVVHSEKLERPKEDEEAETTARLVKAYGTSYVVCDPAGGGKPFFEKFNAKYGKVLGCQIRAADKVDKFGSIAFLNTELRTGRLQFFRPAADPVVKELKVLRWRDEARTEILEGKDYPDHGFDALRYALNQSIAWAPKPQPTEQEVTRAQTEADFRQRLKTDPELREAEERNRQARKDARKPWYARR